MAAKSKNLLVVVSVNWTIFFASGKHRENGLKIVHGKMSFLSTEYAVKIILQLQILCQQFFSFLAIFIVDHSV